MGPERCGRGLTLVRETGEPDRIFDLSSPPFGFGLDSIRNYKGRSPAKLEPRLLLAPVVAAVVAQAVGSVGEYHATAERYLARDALLGHFPAR